MSSSNICGKLYSYILHKTLTHWIETSNIINEIQAGFRQQYSTVDHHFTLVALMQKQLSYHKKLYVSVIDFRKAFDSVDCLKLWTILWKYGVNGKMHRAITCVYNVVKAQVRSGSDLTDAFMCPRSLKQGDNYSPVLIPCSFMN